MNVVDMNSRKDPKYVYTVYYRDGKTFIFHAHHLGWDAVNEGWILGFKDDNDDSEPTNFVNTAEVNYITKEPYNGV